MRKLSRALLLGAGCAIACGAAWTMTGMRGASQANVEPVSRPLNWAEPMIYTRVDNLHRITPSLYRSAQISASDLPQLRALGIRKIISFRSFHADEPGLAESGIVLERIPINTWNIRDEDMITALKALRDVNRDGPILIHCQHGADRTGLVSALYRIVYQGWTKQQAEEELLKGGFGFHPVWVNIRSYLERVDIERLKQQAGIPAKT